MNPAPISTAAYNSIETCGSGSRQDIFIAREGSGTIGNTSPVLKIIIAESISLYGTRLTFEASSDVRRKGRPALNITLVVQYPTRSGCQMR
jgi:hypothetical protein